MKIKTKIKYKIVLIFASIIIPIGMCFYMWKDTLDMFRKLWSFRCYQCGAKIEDPKKLMKHIQLGCFDVK